MNVLYVTNKPIYPIVDGGCFAMDSFLRSLIRFATVKNLTVETHKHPFNFHQFHKDCIVEWLGFNGICPICKESITVPDN